MQEQGFSLWIAHQRPLHRDREKRKMTLIERDRKLSDIQCKEKKGI
jgi:hypothetical protein